ncbi:4Fe-4S dicluster domain-containing protein [Deltaproteobacteria bacterium]|nr:4Fe-4S dicluster domain-containing protein [Deltaproteobacteria bacterium]
MESILHLNPQLRKQIESDAQAKSNMCWTCQSCVTECPVNIATNRLNPMKIIRMANFGLLDELLSEPSLWYCQSCNRCNQICPMTVKPANVIAFFREEMLRKKLVSLVTFTNFFNLLRQFQRVRWYAVYCCLKKHELTMSKTQWGELLRTPVKPTNGKILLDPSLSDPSLAKVVKEADTLSCFNCSGCSGSCPAFYERSLFDPQLVFRMANLGLLEELLSSPAIWLCVGCERCTNSCSQLVKGHLIIQRLRTLSVKKGFVPLSFPEQLRELDKTIYPYLLDEIDSMFGFSHISPNSMENG